MVLSDLSWTTLLVLSLSLVALVIVKRKTDWHKRTKGVPFPPSRKGWPILGNALDLPPVLGSEWEAYVEWGKELGSDIIYIDGGTKSIVVLNSKEGAEDLLDKKSRIFSSRPKINMVDHMGWDWILPLLPYGEEWKTRRRLFYQYFHPSDNNLHRERSLEFLYRMLGDLLHSPDDVLGHAKRFISAVMFSLAYGMDLIKEPQYFSICAEAIDPLVQAIVPGRFLIDFIPWLKYVPAWVPGAGFQKKAATWRVFQEKFKIVPFAESLRRLNEGGDYPTCFVSLAMSETHDMEDGPGKDERISAIRDTAAMFYAAGSETTISVIEFLFFALVLHPEVQKKAQRELDMLLAESSGTNDGSQYLSLPTFEDAPNLPYITALVKEVIRWQPVAPIGVPHVSTADHIYNRYFIPEGSIVIGNNWAMLRNEEVYPDAQLFKPERFLNADGTPNPDVPDPYEVIFGFGRRICPARHIGASSVFITAASVLALFDVVKTVGEDGKEIEPVLEATNGLARGLKPFKCTLRPRSEAARGFVEALGS